MPAGDDNLSSSKHTKDASIFMMVKTGWTRFLLLLLCLCKEFSQKWQRGLSFILLSEKKIELLTPITHFQMLFVMKLLTVRVCVARELT